MRKVPRAIDTKMTERPAIDEYHEFYSGYIGKVPSGNLIQIAEEQITELRATFATISESQSSVLHPPYTWTIKQVIGHMIDTDRVFGDRLHRFAAADFQPLNGMDQDPYVDNLDYESPTLSALVDELLHCRQANALLLRRLPAAAWDRRGIASGHSVTVRALAYMQVGHVTHHMRIIEKRVLD
jgi:hypothetical protein